MSILELPAVARSGLQLQLRGAVLHLELNRPGGILNGAVLEALQSILHTLPQRPDIRVLIMAGAGDDFSLGGDLEEYRQTLLSDPSGAAARSIADRAYDICHALQTTTAVTIARLRGRAIGAGLALAAFCDLRVGDSTFRGQLPEMALGVVPAWGGALPRLMSEAGPAHVRTLLLTSSWIDAATAHQIGILNALCAPTELDDQISTWAERIVRRDPETVVTTKRLLTQPPAGLTDAHLLSMSMATRSNSPLHSPPRQWAHRRGAAAAPPTETKPPSGRTSP